jgi:hypothetical protein
VQHSFGVFLICTPIYLGRSPSTSGKEELILTDNPVLIETSFADAITMIAASAELAEQTRRHWSTSLRQRNGRMGRGDVLVRVLRQSCVSLTKTPLTMRRAPMEHQKRKRYPELDFDPGIPPELDVLLDPPPVLDKDAAESHQLTFMGFAHVVQPRDFIEWIYVRDAADHRCEVTWLRRLKTRIVRRPRKNFAVGLLHKIFSSCDAEINKMEEGIKADLSTTIRQLRGDPDKIKAETEKLQVAAKGRLEAAIDKLQYEAWDKMKAQERAINSELQEADFFEEWFELYKQVDDLLRRAEQEFENDLRRIDEHRQGLGARLRNAAMEMIDGEFEEVNNPAPRKPTLNTKMPTRPATPETDMSLSIERLKIDPAETVVSSGDASPSPEGPRPQPEEAAFTVTPLVSLASAETPPFPSESSPTESAVSTEVPRAPEEPKAQP